ncbi:MAG: aspartate aminotransferase family protein [Pseudomonadota bacterium]
MMPAVMPTSARADMAFVRGEGSWIYTDKDEVFLDFGAGIAVNVLGHGHPTLVEALTHQAEKLWHTSNLYHVPNQEKLAGQLVEASFADTVFFTNSGAEAMECAVKMARKFHFENGAPERVEIISFQDSFHGRTLGMISAAGAEKLTKGFGPLLPGFVHLPFGDHDALEAAITDRTAAILLEPIQGEGGIIPVPDQCLRGLRDLCDRHGILLILDEIQCGMGRTGKLFAHEWSGIAPDIMAIAKAIGGGFPLGACLATANAASGMTAGTHGSTYGGNPLGCAVGSAVMDIVAEQSFLQSVNRRAGQLRQSLESLVAEFPNVFSAVRGAGLMLGLVCKVPNTDVVKAGYSQRLLTVPGGQNVIRILPPLNLSDDDMAEGVSRLRSAASSI